MNTFLFHSFLGFSLKLLQYIQSEGKERKFESLEEAFKKKQTVYFRLAGHSTQRSYIEAPHNGSKHRFSNIYKRVQVLVY